MSPWVLYAFMFALGLLVPARQSKWLVLLWGAVLYLVGILVGAGFFGAVSP